MTHSIFGALDVLSVSVTVVCVVSTVALVGNFSRTSLDFSQVASCTTTWLPEGDDIWEEPCSKEAFEGFSLVVTITDDELVGCCGVCCGEDDTKSLKTENTLFAGSLGAADSVEVDEFAVAPAPGV